jgi:hypothetical protein
MDRFVGHYLLETLCRAALECRIYNYERKNVFYRSNQVTAYNGLDRIITIRAKKGFCQNVCVVFEKGESLNANCLTSSQLIFFFGLLVILHDMSNS